MTEVGTQNAAALYEVCISGENPFWSNSRVFTIVVFAGSGVPGWSCASRWSGSEGGIAAFEGCTSNEPLAWRFAGSLISQP